MPYRIFFQGDAALAQKLRDAVQASSHPIDVFDGSVCVDATAEVIVLGPDTADLLASAQRLHQQAPAAGIVCLLDAAQLDHFRSLLPFVPHLASVWTIATNTSAATLADLLGRAAESSSRRHALKGLRADINRRLASRPETLAAAAEDHRLHQVALSESYYATLLARAPDAIIALLSSGIVAAWNDAAARLFARPVESAIGRHASEVFPAQMRAALGELIRLGLQGQTITAHELRFASVQGELCVELNLVPVIASDGTISTLSVTARNVTAGKRIESALCASEKRYRTLAETLPQLVWSASADGACTYLSQQWFDYTGMSENLQLGWAWLDDAIHPDDRERAREHWLGAVAEQHPYDIEFRIRRHDGAFRWFKVRGTAIRGTHGAVEEWFGTCTDIDEAVHAREALTLDAKALEQRVASETARRREAEDALRHAQKMEAIGNLTGGVAHDFNNLLQVISGNLQLLADNVADDARASRRLRNAMDGVDRGAKLAAQLLAFGRRQSLVPKVVNLARLISNMGDLLRHALGEAVEIETIVAAGLWNTLVDPGNVENALLNLAINARDAMQGRGQLTIEVGNALLDHDYAQIHHVQAGQYVMLAVTDTGTGMPPEIVARVFEPFFTTKAEGHGTGLGLSMVYGFVKQSSGHVKIYSEPGHGTTIKLYLPRSTQSEDVLSDLPAGPLVGGSETILIAEDDEAVRETVVSVLRDLGYRVLQARDAQRALSIIESGMAIDLLFTDVVMPGHLKSPELARKAKAHLPHLAVLFTSGYTANAIVHGGRLDEGVELLSKPYTREALARRVRQLLAQRAQRVLADAARHSAMPPPAAAPRTILLCEDDASIREVTAELLRARGHAVIEARDAAQAIALFAGTTIEVLLTDIGLPDLSGIELAEQLRASDPTLPVLFATGNAHDVLPCGDTRTGVLLKPYNGNDLTTALATLKAHSADG